MQYERHHRDFVDLFSSAWQLSGFTPYVNHQPSSWMLRGWPLNRQQPAVRSSLSLAPQRAEAVRQRREFKKYTGIIYFPIYFFFFLHSFCYSGVYRLVDCDATRFVVRVTINPPLSPITALTTICHRGFSATVTTPTARAPRTYTHIPFT